MTPQTTEWAIHEHMMWRVARALGPDLTGKVAFVGGCATAVLVTDPLVRQSVRLTDDVDVIVHILTAGEWYELAGQLARLGFRTSPEDEVLCRMRLRDGEPHELIVDFMPDDPSILGFTNDWYGEAVRLAIDHALHDGTVIRVVDAPHFIATKIQAFLGRGGNDPLSSRDIEDILNVIDGRPTLLEDMRTANEKLRAYVATQIAELIRHKDFVYAVQSCASQSASRQELILDRVRSLTAL